MRLSDFIRQNVQQIVDEWQRFAGTLGKAESEFDSATLRDHSLEILLAISDDIETRQSSFEALQKSRGDKPPASKIAETAAHIHGTLRQQIGFNIVDLAAEYRALRASVLYLWQKSGDTGLIDFIESMRFNEAIDEALAQSIDRFSRDVDRSRDIFLGILGHDIRTPLSAITLSSELIARSERSAETTAKAVERIRRNAKTIDQIVSDLLDFVRMDIGNQIPMSRTPGSLADIAHAAVDDCEAAHPNAKFDFKTAGDVRGDWDAPRLGQAFRNLISNAIVYGAGDDAITVRVEGREDGVEASVENSGEAIPSDALATLFDPFIRVTSRQGGSANPSGLGLGLYIVNEIVMAHGGRLGVTSSAGKTVFSLSLPRQLPVA